ncbi:aldo/keto reductase [Aestuariivirga sp.]|uniref:aldo/keto reductase n=1 Tax=Aestuariivirga sp. TaxID=2650926 RepID=UPI003594705D
MKQRRIGQDGPLVGEVGFGAMSFAGFFGPTDKETSHRTLARALDLGVTHIDTALIYGPYVSEDFIGEFLRHNPAARTQFSIATKGGIVPNPRKFDNSPGFLRECLDGSLKRLGVERVDLYYVHRRDQTIPIEDVTGTLVAFKNEGKIGGFGFSEISPSSLERAASIHPVAAVQNEYSLWSRQPELGMLQACKRLGTTFVAFSPVARGALTDVALDPATFADSDFRKRNPRFEEQNFTRNMERIAKFKAFARARGWSTAALAIAWVLRQGDHIIPIPGTRTPEHLAENASAAAISLSEDEWREIDAILPPGFAHGHRYSDQQINGTEQYC